MKNKGRKNVIDIHSHILPALDDGAKDWEQSDAMLSIAYRQGIKTIIATPHYMPDSKKGNSERILKRVKMLQDHAEEYDYDMNIYAGNEVYYHEEVPDLLDEGEILTLAGSTYVLVEFSPADDARYIRNALRNIQAFGYKPVIAHVERYENICKKPFDKIEELRQMGILVQVNMSTIEGRMGKKMQRIVMKLLKKQMVDLLGTDAHSDGHRSPQAEGCVAILQKKLPSDYVDRLLYKNAEMIIQDGIENGTEDQ